MNSSYTPKLGDIVQVRQQQGTYRVTWFDDQSRKVELARVAEGTPLTCSWEDLEPTGYTAS